MNATATIFALALASNTQPEHHFQIALTQLAQHGHLICSDVYLIPCREGIGADYWNAACLWTSTLSVEEVLAFIKKMEMQSGRVRPSHKIFLDIDLIAWGDHLTQMQFNIKKLPLALDVKIPFYQLWKHAAFQYPYDIQYPKLVFKC